jgi:riboflavin biosynthesis pyrimidine reductase
VSAEDPRFRVLHPASGDGTSVDAATALAGWREDRPDGAGVALNFISSVDGRVAVNGRSAPLGSPADRALFHALRSRADAVLVGAGTVRDERYGPLIKAEPARAARRREGLEEQPLALIVTSSLDLDPALPLLHDPDSRVAILTSSSGQLPPCNAHVDYVRSPSLAESLALARERYGLDVVLCEGGPSLSGALAAAGLIDELFLSLAPMIVGDVPGASTMLRRAGPPAPLALDLRMLLESGATLFARYVAA